MGAQVRPQVQAICAQHSHADIAAEIISFTRALPVRQRTWVRWLAFLWLAFFCCHPALAQNQEQSLVDRLLRPNMDLHNKAQGKAFRADSKVVAHSGNAGTFVLKSPAKEKTFADTRTVAHKQYRSGQSRADLGENAFVSVRDANVQSRSKITTSSVRDVHPAYDARLAVSGRSAGEERVFREEGKSQKSLSRQNPPLTIDQVRELLNKNK